MKTSKATGSKAAGSGGKKNRPAAVPGYVMDFWQAMKIIREGGKSTFDKRLTTGLKRMASRREELLERHKSDPGPFSDLTVDDDIDAMQRDAGEIDVFTLMLTERECTLLSALIERLFDGRVDVQELKQFVYRDAGEERGRQNGAGR